MRYNIKLDIFEGPLDLLLHLIKKNEVDIYDIPISTVTEQYLEYIDLMKDMNLDFAGEFLVMAATLVHIKSKMLLPVDQSPEGEEDEGPDPRQELVQKLIEYQKYKLAAADLNQRLLLGRDVFLKGADAQEGVPEETGFVNVSVFDLMEALKGIIARAPKERRIELTVERYRIADKINHVLEALNANKTAVFTELFAQDATKGEVIVTFLAILELAKLLLIKIRQTDDGMIRVYSHSADKNSAAQTAQDELALEPSRGSAVTEAE